MQVPLVSPKDVKITISKATDERFAGSGCNPSLRAGNEGIQMWFPTEELEKVLVCRVKGKQI